MTVQISGTSQPGGRPTTCAVADPPVAAAACSSRGPATVTLLLLLCGVFGVMWNSGLRSGTIQTNNSGGGGSSSGRVVLPVGGVGTVGGVEDHVVDVQRSTSSPIAGWESRGAMVKENNVARPIPNREDCAKEVADKSGDNLSREAKMPNEAKTAPSAEARATAWLLRQQGFYDNRLPELQLPFDLTLCSFVYFDFGTNLGYQFDKLYLGTKPDSPWGKQFTRYFGTSLEDRVKNVCAIGSEPNRELHAHLAVVEDRLRKRGARVKIFHAPVWVSNDKVVFNQVHDDNAAHDSSSIATKKQGLGRVKDGKWTNEMNVTTYETRALRFAALLNFVNPNATAIAKLDIEGAEHRVLLDLLLSGNVCRLNFLGVELHSHLMKDDMHDLEFMSNTVGTKRKKDMSLKRMANVLSQSQRCQKTEVTVFDDET